MTDLEYFLTIAAFAVGFGVLILLFRLRGVLLKKAREHENYRRLARFGKACLDKSNIWKIHHYR